MIVILLMTRKFYETTITTCTYPFFLQFFTYPHGYVKSPESRSYLCRKEVNTNCGQIQYEPQSLEGPKGFPQQGLLMVKLLALVLSFHRSMYKQLSDGRLFP